MQSLCAQSYPNPHSMQMNDADHRAMYRYVRSLARRTILHPITHRQARKPNTYVEFVLKICRQVEP